MAQIGIFYGSVYGNAQQLAEDAEQTLRELGHNPAVQHEPDMSALRDAEELLFISSTTGQGDIPPNLEPFVLELESSFPLLRGKPFSVVGLGDSSYGDTYCGAGRRLFALLEELQGEAKAPLLKVDACETLDPQDEVLPWLRALYS